MRLNYFKYKKNQEESTEKFAYINESLIDEIKVAIAIFI